MYTYPKPCRITQSQSLEREDSTLASILSLLSWVGPVKARPEHGGQDGQPSSPRGQGLSLAPPVITGGVSPFGKPEPTARTQESRETDRHR